MILCDTICSNSSACVQASADLVFLLDSSGSMSTSEFQQMKDFVKDFISDADVDGGNVRVAVNVFSKESNIEFNLNTHSSKADILAAVDAIDYKGGSTNVADGILTTRTEMFAVANGDRPGVDNIIILMSDGKSTKNTKRTIPEAELARNEGIHIYTIAIGYQDLSELDAISSKPVDENRFVIENFGKLKELKKKVFAAFCGK